MTLWGPILAAVFHRSGAHIGSPTERYTITRGQRVGPCRVGGCGVVVVGGGVVRLCERMSMTGCPHPNDISAPRVLMLHEHLT